MRSLTGTLAIILHADVADSTTLVHLDKELAHQRIRDSFKRLSNAIETYHGRVLELRGDALLASFDRASDAVIAAVSFQTAQTNYIENLQDDIKPSVRVGISMGEVIIADNTVTGAGVVQAQRIEQLAVPGTVCISAAIHEALSRRALFDLENLGEQILKGLEHPVHVYRISLKQGESAPPPEALSKGKSAYLSWSKAGLVILVAAIVAIAYYYWLKQTAESTSEKRGDESALQSSSNDTSENNKSDVDGFQDCPQCPVMLIIPSGSFSMGYDMGDPDEKPVNEVKIDYDLAVSKFEVTFEEWDYCVSEGGCNNYLPKDKDWGRGRQPVIFVSWLDAQSYVMWLRDKTGKNYRLLTEAEWEYAARGGSTTTYPWGVTYDGSKANFGNLKQKTVPVGSYDPNGYGLYDVVGNVWEWVVDCYDKESYSTHDSYPAAVLDSSETCKRVVRGGSWNVDLSDGYDLLRTSIRWRGKSNGRYNHFGIRVARDR